MYLWPVTLPLLTNREDFYTTVSIYDDDLGVPINLAGISTANPGQPFTASAWTVTDGQIVTTSATPITIPGYPFTNQLSALPLNVGVGLALSPGDPITIADTASGLNTMIGYVASYAAATGALVVQIGVIFRFEIRKFDHHGIDSDYVEWYDFGTPNSEAPLISAQLGTGITFIDVGYIQIQVPATVVQQLKSGTHRAAMTMADGAPNTRQIFLAELPILYGAVSTVGNQATPASWQAQF